MDRAAHAPPFLLLTDPQPSTKELLSTREVRCFPTLSLFGSTEFYQNPKKQTLLPMTTNNSTIQVTLICSHLVRMYLSLLCMHFSRNDEQLCPVFQDNTSELCPYFGTKRGECHGDNIVAIAANMTAVSLTIGWLISMECSVSAVSSAISHRYSALSTGH